VAKTLVIAEVYEGEFRSATLNAVQAARDYQAKAGAAFDILVLGQSTDAAVAEVKGLGAGKVLVAQDAALAHYTAEHWGATIAAVAKGGYDVIMVAATTTGKDLAPRVAALLDAGMASDVAEIVSADTFKRPVFAGNVIATVQVDSAIKVLSIRGTAFDKAEPAGGESPVESVSATASSVQKAVSGFEGAGGGDRPELTDASVVVAGGRGTKGDFEAVYKLADALKAAVGASRAVVDAGWAPNDWQVGQTGKVVAPGLYIALGISGAIQHWAGMKDSKVIVAINKDPEAPIMELADYVLVADLFAAAPELADKVEALKASGQISL
jgi:electron transfer flavoprotein alpha subunit